MKKALFFVLTILLLTSCKGKNKEIVNNKITFLMKNNFSKEGIKNMDTIYKQQHEKLTIISTRLANNTKIEWKTILIDSNNNEVLLDSFSEERTSDWKELEYNYGYTQLNDYTVSSSYLDGNNLYVIYQNSNKVIISKYIFNDKISFKREDKKIQNHYPTTYVSDNEVFSTIKIFDESIYVNLSYGVFPSGKEQTLYKIDMNSFEIKKIIFNKNYKIIKGYAQSDSAKINYYEKKTKIEAYNKMTNNEKKKNKSSAPTREEIDYVNALQKYLDKPFDYEKMSLNKDIYYKENLDFEKLGLKPYVLFKKTGRGIKEYLQLDEKKILKADFYLNQVLATYEKNIYKKPIDYLGYIYQSRPEYMILFFHKNNSLNIEITRYGNSVNEWLIGGYSEEDINLEY